MIDVAAGTERSPTRLNPRPRWSKSESPRPRPEVGQAMTWTCGRRVDLVVELVGTTRFGRHDRRALVVVPERQAEAVELGVFAREDHCGDRRRRSSANSSSSPKSRGSLEFGRQDLHVLCGNRRWSAPRSDDALPRRSPAVTRSPTVEHRGKLPAEVDGISDASVEAVATPGRILVCRVTDEEDSLCGVLVGEQHVGAPGVGGEDLDFDLLAKRF